MSTYGTRLAGNFCGEGIYRLLVTQLLTLPSIEVHYILLFSMSILVDDRLQATHGVDGDHDPYELLHKM